MGLRDIANKVRGESSSSGDFSKSTKVSRESSSPEGRADMEDFMNLLLALGEMQMYSQLLKKDLEDGGNKKEKIAAETASDVSGSVVEFAGSFGVKDIAEDNGVDWDSDVMGRIASGEVRD